MDKRAISLDVSDAKFSQSMLLMSAVLNKGEEIARLRIAVENQGAQLLPPSTASAQLLEPIYSSAHPVFPNKKLILFGGLMGGLVFGGIAFVALRYLRATQLVRDGN